MIQTIKPLKRIPMANENKMVTRAAGVIGLATFASRIMGFLRDMATAWFFGAGLLSDAFFVAFRIPNMLRRLLAEGSLSMVFVPVFTEYLTGKGRDEAFRMAFAMFRFLSVVLVAVTLAGILFSPGIVRLMAPGFGGEKLVLTVFLTRIMFPYVFFICLVALCMGMLNVLGHFAAPALAPVLLNLAMIGGMIFIAPHMQEPVVGLAIGVIIGGILQLALQAPFMWRHGFRFYRKTAFFHPGVQRVVLLMGPAVIGAAVHQINIFVGTLLASLLPEGSVSYLYYADRLVEFPLGIFAISLSVAVLPSLSRQAAARDFDAMSQTFSHAMNLTFFITLPAMVGLIIMSKPIIALLFQHGAFDAESTHDTAFALICYSSGLWAYSAVRILVSTFYSLQDTRTPVKMATIAIIANILLSLALMGKLLHGGLALATALASMINFCLLAYALREKMGSLGWKKMIVPVFKSVICSLVMGAGLWTLLAWFPTPEHFSKIAAFTRVMGGVGVGMILYIAAAVLLKCRELNDMLAMFKKG
jgi:putative peptidoglycan lipid II flippase